MKNMEKLNKDFFTKERKIINKEKCNNLKDDCSKIEPISWKKEILEGKEKVIVSLPNDNKMV